MKIFTILFISTLELSVILLIIDVIKTDAPIFFIPFFIGVGIGVLGLGKILYDMPNDQ